MKINKLAIAILSILIVTVSIFAAACSPNKSSTTSTTSTTSAASTAHVASGNLNLYNIDPYTLDPATASEATSQEYIQQIFSGLIALDDNLNPVGDIAQSWKIDSTGTVYTFELRQDVKFSDGKQVTASDFKYSWERACNPATGSQTAGTYLGDIAGVSDVLAGKSTTISGVKVVDSTTLQVTILKPHPYFLDKLSYSVSFVVEASNVSQGANWWKTPTGTGPFELKSWTTGQQLVLQDNPYYYGEKAKLATVTYKLWSGVPQRLYETGDIDATDVGTDYIDMVTDPAGQYLSQLKIYPEMSFSYIGFNCTQPPFDDPNIRKAFTMAVDKQKLVTLLFKGMESSANGILPPGMPGYNAQLQGLNFDVNQALALIKQSKYGSVANLPPITLTTSGYGANASSTITAIVYDWKQYLGVDVNVRVLDPDVFFYALKNEKDQLFDIGWIADYPYPQDFLEVLFGTGQDNNWGEYSNSQVDAILNQAGVETDNQRALTLYQQAEQILVNDGACIPLWFAKEYVLTKPYVSGYIPNAMGVVKLNKVSVSN